MQGAAMSDAIPFPSLLWSLLGRLEGACREVGAGTSGLPGLDSRANLLRVPQRDGIDARALAGAAPPPVQARRPGQSLHRDPLRMGGGAEAGSWPGAGGRSNQPPMRAGAAALGADRMSALRLPLSPRCMRRFRHRLRETVSGRIRSRENYPRKNTFQRSATGEVPRRSRHRGARAPRLCLLRPHRRR